MELNVFLLVGGLIPEPWEGAQVEPLNIPCYPEFIAKVTVSMDERLFAKRAWEDVLAHTGQDTVVYPMGSNGSFPTGRIQASFKDSIPAHSIPSDRWKGDLTYTIEMKDFEDAYPLEDGYYDSGLGKMFFWVRDKRENFLLSVLVEMKKHPWLKEVEAELILL